MRRGESVDVVDQSVFEAPRQAPKLERVDEEVGPRVAHRLTIPESAEGSALWQDLDGRGGA
jgi:hypothetical protein